MSCSDVLTMRVAVPTKTIWLVTVGEAPCAPPDRTSIVTEPSFTEITRPVSSCCPPAPCPPRPIAPDPPKPPRPTRPKRQPSGESAAEEQDRDDRADDDP